MIVTRNPIKKVEEEKPSDFKISFTEDEDQKGIQEEVQFKMNDCNLEFDFFKMLVLSVILG